MRRAVNIQARGIQAARNVEVFTLTFGGANVAANTPIAFESRTGRGMWRVIGLSTRPPLAPAVNLNPSVLFTLRDVNGRDFLTDCPLGSLPSVDPTLGTPGFPKAFDWLPVSWEDSFYYSPNPATAQNPFTFFLTVYYGDGD